MTKTALITGGSRGIGFGIALELAKKNYRLAINGVREQTEVADAIEMLKKHSPSVIYCKGSVAEGHDRNAILQQVKDTFGELHVLINNAGVAPKTRTGILQMTEESYDRVMNTNLKGPLFLSQMAARWMIEQKNNTADFAGCIINISSVSASVASVNRGEYCISKAGMGMLTKLFATQLGEHNIPVYEVRPGVIATDMTSMVKKKYNMLLEKGLSIQNRWGLPEDVGKTVAVLVSGAFPYSTGQVIMVDGGLTVQRM